MKAAVTDYVGAPFTLQEIEIAAPEGREVLIEVRASGLCHSDLHVSATDVGFPLPAVLGHEIAGVVAACGPDVTGFRPGQHVVSSPISSCGHCSGCLTGRPYQCRAPQEAQRPAGAAPRLTRDGAALTQFIGVGGFAEQVLVHENSVVGVSEELPFDRAALLGCGVVTGAGAAINSARIRPGDTAVVIGCGGVGLNVIQGAALAGARRIIAVDLQPAKLELAGVFGATDVINPGDTDAVAAVLDLTGGGATHAFEVVGQRRTAMDAVAMLGIGGTAYLIGVHRPGATIDVTPFGDLMGRQKGIRGVPWVQRTPRWTFRCTPSCTCRGGSSSMN